MLPLLRIEDLTIAFDTESGPFTAVRNLGLELKRGELLALVGESGSGKSVTSLSLLRLLPSPPASYPSGRLLFSPDGQQATDLLQAQAGELRAIRGGRIGIIFQEPMSSLNPVMTCGEQVMEALQAHKALSQAEARAQTIEWFRKVKLPQPEALVDRYPHQLSGGQKQRVMIAMALCCRPALLICDEPTTALDVTVQKAVLELIRELQQELNMGVLFITHDLGVVAEIADRVAILYKGELVETGTARQVFAQPAHPYTKALIACRPALHPRGERLPVVSDFLEPGKAMDAPPKALKKTVVTGNLVEVEKVSVRYPTRTDWRGRTTAYFTAVDDVSFTIGRGETLGLVGESGCGKTTLGRTLLRLIEPTSGRITFEGTDITFMDKRKLKSWRREVQLVFQDPFSSLNPRLSIGDALMEALPAATDRRNRRKQAADLLDRVSLPSTALRRYPHEFSGGQRQRIVIARALAPGPAFLVCDESVSALDVSVQAGVLNLLNELKADLGLTLLFISHDLSVVRYMSDRLLVMQAGRIVESGPAEDVYQNPSSDYTRQLIAAIPEVNPGRSA